MERVYRIVADGSSAINALNKISDSANKLESGMGKVGSALSAATKAFAGFAAAKGLGGITSATEQIATLEASLSTLRGSAEAGADMLQRVFAIVGNTGADLDGVATSIQRLSIGMQDMGANNAQIAAVAENFIKLGKVGGTSMADVNGALVQFGQALSSGVLQGDEFKSLSERMPLLMKGLAKEIGVSAGELKRMGSEGKITADVLANTLLKLGPELQADFAALPVTFEQGMNKLKLTTTVFLAELGKTSGIMDTVSASLDYINDGLKNVASSTSAIGAIGGVLKVAFQAVAVVASDLAFVISGIASDIVRLGRVAAALATGDFANIPKIWAETASEQEKAKKELDAYQAKIMGLAPAMKEVAKAGKSVGTIKAGPSAAALKKMADEAKKAADELKRIKEAAADREIDAITRQFDDIAKATKAAADELKRIKEAAQDREIDAISQQFDDMAKATKAAADELKRIQEAAQDREINAISQQFEDMAKATQAAADELKKIKEAEADREIDAIARQFDDMAKATKAAADEMIRLREAAADRELDAIASSFDRLKVANPLTTITDELNALGQRVRDLDALREKLDDLYFSGKITSDEFEHLGKKFGTFVETASSSDIGGKLTGLVGILDSNFNSFFENMERGTASASDAFKRMAESILAQILRLAAQKVILSAFGLNIGGGKRFAKGGAFGGATGLPWGVYDKPTYFNMPGNGPLQKYAKGGVLGEAGYPEAILPLRRTSSGKLGVESTAPVVNIYNSSGASVRAEEDKNGGIAVYIEQVKNSISRDIRSGAGVVTSALQGTYGLSRAAGAR
jgi:tape measure domain-containing protein